MHSRTIYNEFQDFSVYAISYVAATQVRLVFSTRVPVFLYRKRNTVLHAAYRVAARKTYYVRVKTPHDVFICKVIRLQQCAHIGCHVDTARTRLQQHNITWDDILPLCSRRTTTNTGRTPLLRNLQRLWRRWVTWSYIAVTSGRVRTMSKSCAVSSACTSTCYAVCTTDKSICEWRSNAVNYSTRAKRFCDITIILYALK